MLLGSENVLTICGTEVYFYEYFNTRIKTLLRLSNLIKCQQIEPRGSQNGCNHEKRVTVTSRENTEYDRFCKGNTVVVDGGLLITVRLSGLQDLF